MISIIQRIIYKIIREIKSIILSRKIDEGNGRITVLSNNLPINIIKGEGSKLFINGSLRFQSHCGGSDPVYINIGKDATLLINGDFIIGQGVRIIISNNASLSFGGKDIESDSGITSDVLIMVYKKIEVGKDFICAWNVYISDSDWHTINGQPHHEDVVIGNHVWIANNCSILKGANIGNNIIVASHSKVSKGYFPEDTLIAGTPAKVIRQNVQWNRDIN